MEIVKAAAAIDDIGMQDIVRSLESDLENLTRLVEVVYERLSEPVKKLRRTIPWKVDAVLDQITTLKNNLDTYEATTRMNTDFYM